MGRGRSESRSSGGKRAEPLPTLGFGVPATSDPHHFRVIIPRNAQGRVQISEYLGLQALTTESEVIDRVLLDRPRWMAVRAEVQRAFNARLTAADLRPASWKVGENLVDRLLGKELCVLAWAIEQLEIERIPVAVRNWLALRPEERWWLFGMTAMVTGGIADAGRGWRIALQHALGDIAQSEQLLTRSRPSRSLRVEKDRATLNLFGAEAGAGSGALAED